MSNGIVDQSIELQHIKHKFTTKGVSNHVVEYVICVGTVASKEMPSLYVKEIFASVACT